MDTITLAGYKFRQIQILKVNAVRSALHEFLIIIFNTNNQKRLLKPFSNSNRAGKAIRPKPVIFDAIYNLISFVSNPDVKPRKEGLNFNQTASNCSLNYLTV